MSESEIPVALLHELLSLDEATGALRWKARQPRHFQPTRTRTAEHICNNWNSLWAGQSALDCHDACEHLTGRINGILVYAHRVVFAMTHGKWPSASIDHINGVPFDNRPGNLRDVSHAINRRNSKRSSANVSGITGVNLYKRSGKWGASITVDGQWLHLGYFDRKEDAAAARKQAEVEHGFHPNHGRKAA